MEFHEKIQKLMAEKGWSQAYLAQKISVTSQRMSLWLKGTGVPKPYQLLKIARCFGVDAEYLLDDEREDPVRHSGCAPGDAASSQAAANTPSEDERLILTLYRALGLSRDQALKGLALMVERDTEARS